jgi:hypothetical protein
MPAVPFVLSAAHSAVYRRMGEARWFPKSTPTSSGVARQLVTFSCFAKEKVTKKKATPAHRPFGVPCVAQPDRPPHKLARSAARPRAQTYSSDTPCLVCATRRCTGEGKAENQNQNCSWARSAQLPKKYSVGYAHKKPELNFSSPVRRLDISQTSGGLDEHCPSSAVRHGVCASLGRVAQPRLLAKYRGNPAGAAHRGRLLWVTFLGKTRKVTSCRATPDGVS